MCIRNSKKYIKFLKNVNFLYSKSKGYDIMREREENTNLFVFDERRNNQ